MLVQDINRHVGQNLVPRHGAGFLVDDVALPRACALLRIGTDFLAHVDANICELVLGRRTNR